MEHYPVQEDSLGRLRYLGQEWGIIERHAPSPEPRPDKAPSYRTDRDEFLAEELLRRQRVTEVGNTQSKGGISRAFTTKKKAWEYKEIYNALISHITDQGSPGVAEVLVTMLNLSGGNLNLTQKTRNSFLGRRKSLDLGERSRVLQIAVKNGQYEMVEVLLPHADAFSLDTALPFAIRDRDEAITELLVRYGAGVADIPDGEDAFRQICAVGGQAELVGLVLGSNGPPSASCASLSMIDAARAGCLDSVTYLSLSNADGNFDGAAALKTAVGLGRKDIALALVLGNKPPTQPGINEAFEQLMAHENINPNEKLAIAEILLCAGAGGDLVSQALIQASAKYFLEMVHLLVSHDASIEYEDAKALKRAVSKGKIDLVEVMLNGKSYLNSEYASECVQLLPKKMRFEERYSFLNLLLKKGASGPPLDEALVDAADMGDVEAAKLLLTPVFPGGKIIGNRDLKKGPRSMVFERHATASTDHKGGLALQIAVKRADAAISNLILTSDKRPTPVALAQIFPSTRNLPRRERLLITEQFLKAGLTGPAVSSALENAIDEHQRRDEKLIHLFLQYHVDVNFNEGHTITAAIIQQDVGLLQRLLKSKPAADIVVKAVSKVMDVNNPSVRFQMICMLLGTGTCRGTTEVSAAVDTVVVANPCDKKLLQVLLQQGKADVNLNGGIAIEHAVQHPDPEVLELLLNLGELNSLGLDRGLKAVASLPQSAIKADKLAALLRKTESKDTVNNLLIEEVRSVLKVLPQQQNLSCLKTLLANGANVNALNAAALCTAVEAANTRVVEAMFSTAPAPMSLAFAMPCALRIRDPMDRLTFAQKILNGGMPAAEVNRALAFAVRQYPEDIPLINALLAYADTEDGEALIEAIKSEKQDIIDLILQKKQFPVHILNTSFAHATKGKNKRSRSMSCSSLLKAGASGEVVSDALLAAASDGDLDFGTILVQSGGSVEHKNGQAVVEACKSGAVDVLEMLLAGSGQICQQTLQRGFQAATQVSDLVKRAEIFKLLLQVGVTGEVVDIQLVSAVRYGDEAKDLVRLLLTYGASPDYGEGEAVDKATRSAFLSNLEQLLGIIDVGGRHRKPSSHTLVRALDASWDLSRDTRYTVIEWVFRAGKPVPSAVHGALNRVINEEEPEERLIRLLINHRASPVTNNCQTLIDATRTLPPEIFALLLESRVSSEDASLTFSKAFVADHINSWLSNRGYEIAKHLLKKGAIGDGLGNALVAVLRIYSDTPEEVGEKFVDLFLSHGADVNHNHGEALQVASTQGNSGLLRKLLSKKPNTESLTLAFPRIFESTASEDGITQLINLYTEYRDGDSQVDVAFAHPGPEPVIIKALSQFPRSTKILQALLDVGFYYEQMTTYRVMEDVDEDEPVTLLMWTLLQPQKRISSNVITLLIGRGAKVNFETRVSRVTPLMLAIQTRRPDIVKELLLAGAEVDVADATGKSPLSMASGIGGDLSITMMSNLLAAGAPRNDGSLHNAARELNLPAMQVLVEYQHDPDFPSPIHGGRSALAELCLHAADSGEITTRERAVEKAIAFLLQSGTDFTLLSEGKSALLLALESADPVTTTKILLRTDMWKHINKTFNQYTDEKLTYSPTMYVERVLPQSDHKPQLLALLRANRATDVYYANSGPQPDDMKGLPPHLQAEEKDRKLRLGRIEHEQQEHLLAIQRNKEIAAVQAQIWANQSELEEARKRRAHSNDLGAIQEKARVEEDLWNQAMRQRRAQQAVDLQHQEQLTRASIARAREVADTELAIEQTRQARQIEWEREVGSERVGNANQLSSIRLREREEVEQLDRKADQRFRERLREQKRLVDSQSALAANLNNNSGGGGGGAATRRQIGYVTGELGGPD